MKKMVNEPRIKCFISAKIKRPDKSLRQNGLVSFAIPDLGILFRASYFGSYYELEYMSLLSLLRFIEMNRSAFENQKIDIYCTSSILVYQVSQNAFCPKELEKHKNLVITYKNILNFSLNWIPDAENRAERGMLDLPPLKDSFKMSLKDKSFNFALEDLHKKSK
jgi:hypothetical protein